MDKEICTIFIGKLGFDNDYTFYKDGKIIRLYDRSHFKMNIVEHLSAKDISSRDKALIVQECSPEYLSKIKEILFN